MFRLGLLALVLASLTGCTMFEWLAPHNLWKLNREPPLGGPDGYFSVPAQRTPPTVVVPRSHTSLDEETPSNDPSARQG